MSAHKAWDEVEKAVSDGTLFDADLDTLRKYLKAATNAPTCYNEARHARVAQVLHTIHFLISQEEAEIQQRKNSQGIKQSVHWARVAGVAAIAVLALYILDLFVLNGSDTTKPEKPHTHSTKLEPQSKVGYQYLSSNSPQNQNLTNKNIEPAVKTPVESDKVSYNPGYENREWIISLKGKKFRVRACFVKSDFGNVYIKSEASGKVKEFPRSAFSDADRKYLKSIGK